jgi:DUF4097 and DUF4098 domain-containing protein YvlB
MNRLLLVVIAAASMTALTVGHAYATEQRKVERRVAATATGAVEISNVSGSVEVRGTDKPEVFVRGTLEAEVERIDVLTEAGRTRVHVVLPRKRNIRRGSASLEVFVPHSAALAISTTSADVDARDLSGALEIGTVSGEISAEFDSTDVEIKSVSGDVDLRCGGKSGALTVSTVSGNVTLVNATGALDAVTVSGDLELEMNEASHVRIRTTSGDANLRARLTRDAKVSAETVSGDFSLALPAAGGFTTQIESFSGDIGGCMKAHVQRASQYGPGTRLETKVGEGSARVRAKSLSGDIDICDR